ncbi:hypothetical protein [Brachybacterium hainanense]|uniref:Uncharacterized protein n=1 Tax=Brachybacterium hainanense TaxID=1541174 RepID=A0ABV6RFD0_9MICO
MPARKVIFYGSSLGGFGALCGASAAAAHAVAEVPQIDVRNWFPGAVKKIEDHIIHVPMDAYGARHPERVDVWSRFMVEASIPSFVILTNELDRSFQDQLSLIARVREHPRYAGEDAELVVTARTRGHQVLAKQQAVELIRRTIRDR